MAPAEKFGLCTAKFFHPVRYNQKKGGYRGIFREAGEETGTYFREITDLEFQNHKNVKKKNVLSAHSNKLGQIYVQWDAKLKFQDMSELVWLRGKIY